MWRFLKADEPHPAATRVRLKPSVDLSFTALLYFVATLFIGVAAMNSQTNLLFGVFGLMVGVVLIAAYVSRFSLRKLTVMRAMPEQLVVAEKAAISYEFHNLKRYWPSVSVTLGELDGCEAFRSQPYAYTLHAGPMSRCTVSIEVVPKRRGVHQLDRYQISTSFPFGFVKRAVILPQTDTIVVLPALARVNPRILMLFQSAEKTGSRMRPRRGGSDEFYGLKDYREGENPRLIHWRRSARTGVPVVREMTQVAPPRLLVLVDTLRDANVSTATIEKTIAMAASLASFALEQGHPVGLVAWSGRTMEARPQRGKQQRRELLSLLATLPANSQCSLDELLQLALPHAAVGTTVAIFTPRPLGGTERQGRTIIFSGNDQASSSRYFSFLDDVDFAHSMPVDQEESGFAPDSSPFAPSSAEVAPSDRQASAPAPQEVPGV
jgi:uncharacterized protein (DUF58 family)